MGRLMCTRHLVVMAVAALCLEPIFAFGGLGQFFSDVNQIKREIFERRAMELGMDLEKQATIDKRAFEQRGMPNCATLNIHCDPPNIKKRRCDYGYTPKIKDLDEMGCSCVVEYDCCDKTCRKLTDQDWKLCENEKKYGIGKYYPHGTEDCCDCQTIICMPCAEIILAKPEEGVAIKNDTHRHFFCQNECDEAHKIVDPTTKCPDYICKKRPSKFYEEPKCDSKCHETETKTDKCGYNYEVCKCRNPPQCTPEKPKEIDCHTIEKVLLDVYACDPKDESKCMQCYQWKYSINQPKHINRECKDCEIEKVKDLGCGSFETTCTCRQPRNCHPREPRPPPCHNVEKVINQDSSMCDHSGDKCTPCYHWNFIPIKYNISTATCNADCEFKRPVSLKCGSAQKCVCIGKSKEHCQPEQATTPNCYSVHKKVIPESFMCSEDSAGKCIPCHTWEFVKDRCPPQSPLQCDVKCQTEGRVHTGCDCYEKICRPTVIPQCRPTKPTPDPDCYHEPVKQFRDVFSYDETTKSCIQCYNWEVQRKEVEDRDECPAGMRKLPNKCVSDYTVQGKCNSLVTKCRRNHVTCTERYDGSTQDVCPHGHTKVTLKTSCGDGRDACMDCKEAAEQLWVDPYPKMCYTQEKMILLNQCKIPVLKKKECPREQLIPTPCSVEGMKRKVFYDDCNCPMLKCTGCPTSKHLDIQLILDSSVSMTESEWLDILNYLKSDFVDSVFTVKDSQLAITRYGGTVELLQELAPNVEAKWFDDKKYNYLNMGYTHTAEAMVKSLESFDRKARWNDGNVIKAMIVITDGRSNDPTLTLTDAAKKWKDKGVKTYALGFGTKIDNDELKQISEFYAVKVDTLEKLKKEIMEHLVPNVCEEAFDAVTFTK